MTQAQAQLPRLLRESEQGRVIEIARRDVTIAYLVPRERMESIIETLEFLANPEAMAAVKRDRGGRGRYVPLDHSDED